jgi:hypothetical protein
LVAKDWTLDLTHGAEKADAASGTDSEGSAEGENFLSQEARGVLLGILGKWKGARLGGLDGVELEGDVLVPAPFGKAPVRVHVIVKGGGVRPGHKGSFAFDAGGVVVDSSLQAYDAASHGRLAIAMDFPRTLKQVAITADFSLKGGSLPEAVAFSAEASEAFNPDNRTCALTLTSGSRRLASISATFDEETRRWMGTWSAGLRASDLAPFMPDRSLPAAEVDGHGKFNADSAFARVHAAGELNAAATGLGALAPALDRLGSVTASSRFDVSRSGGSVRFDSLSLDLKGIRPVALARSLQPFDFDDETGDIKAVDSHSDWMDISISGLPLAWLSGFTNGFAFSGGDATGEFTVQAAEGGFALRPKMPLIAADVSVRRGSTVLARGFDLSLSLLANDTSQGWQMQLLPLAIGSAGQRVASAEAKASRPAGADQPIAIAGTWSADLDALAARSAAAGGRRIPGRLASGDFSASVGAATEWNGKVALLGHDPDHAVSASVHAAVDAYGVLEFSAPVRIAFGSNASETLAEGTWTSDKAGPVIDAKLSGKTVALEHLRWLAAPFALRAAPQDGDPFWGGWTGGLAVAFDHVKAGKRDFKDVAGTFYVDRGALRLEGGQTELSGHGLAKMDGSITFDPAAKVPYSLKATGAIDQVDAAALFGPSKPGQDAVLEGRFSVAGTLTGDGVNLPDLAAHTQEEFRLTGTNGIIRLLKTSVAESLPPPPSRPASDALDSARSAVDTMFGFKQKSDPGAIHLGKNTEAVLNFSYQVAEIGYDQLTVTATRGLDRAIHLADLAINAPDERLSGSGEIGYAQGLLLRARPLTLELQLGVRGNLADLLSTAGLLSSAKDKLGYALLDQPILFGGTLEKIDDSQWRALLAKAATQKPPSPSK